MSRHARFPLRQIIRTESRLLARDGTAVLALLLFVAALGYALWNGYARADADREAYRAVLDQEREQEQAAARQAESSESALKGQSLGSVERYVRHGPTHPQWVGASWSFRVATMPVPPLASIAAGKLDVTPTVYQIRTDRLVEDFRQGEQTTHPLVLSTGVFDVTAVVLFFAPLLVIVLGADLVAGERERGTWALIRAQPVSPARIVSTRLGTRAMLTLLPLVGAAGLVGLLLEPGDQRDGVERLGIWSAGSVAYLAFWWAAVFVITSVQRTTASAVVILVACWVMSVFVVPTGVRLGLDWWAPLPSRAVLVQAQRLATAATEAMPPAAVLADYLRTDAALARQYGSLVPRAATVDFASGPYYLIGEARDFAVERAIKAEVDQLNRARRDQERLAAWASLLSPAMLTQTILLDAAGTGDDALRHYREAVDAFHARWRAFFLPRLFEITPIGADDYEALPRFDYQPPPAADTLRSHVSRYFGLWLLTIVMLGLGWRSIG